MSGLTPLGWAFAGGAGFVLINMLTWLAFQWDKQQARRGAWRAPEMRLLALALFGGWPAAKLAQRRFRHKTRKQPFAGLLDVIVAGWLTVVALFVLAPIVPLP